MKKILFAIAVILSFNSLLIAQNITMNKFKIKNISIFKNGTAFLTKEIVLDVNNNQNSLFELPINNEQALFGSVWFNAEDNKITKVGSYNDSIETFIDVENTSDILKANIGKDVIITLQDYEKPVAAAIFSVNNEVIVLRTKTLWISTKVNFIKHIEFSNQPELKYQNKETKKLISLDFEKTQKKQTVDLMYMQRGLTWTPNYYIRMTGENTALISMKANVINDIEDIENSNINFVVGVPSFAFSYVNAPFTSNQKVVEFLRTLNSDNNDNRSNNMQLSNMITSQGMMNYTPEIDNNPIGDQNELTGKEGSDEGLFFYKLKNISLKKGERAFIDLLETKITYKQLYSVELTENKNIYGSYTRNYSNNQQTKNQVWHSIKFKNNTKTPFTTGTAFILKKENEEYKPVSQNYLYYTPSGIETTVKTTISPDITVLSSEKEISRKENVIKHYNLITIESQIVVENFKNKEIEIEVKRLITGSIIKSDVTYKSTSKLKSWNSKNKENDTRWTMKIKANERKTITYQYKIYVSR